MDNRNENIDYNKNDENGKDKEHADMVTETENSEDIQNQKKETDSDLPETDSAAGSSEGVNADEAEAEDTQADLEEASEDDTSESDDAEASEKDGQSAEKKGFFKKNKKKDKKDEKIEELTDQVKRQMAEFDNFRKRTEKEKTQMFEIGAKSIIEKVLPVVDNFERGLAAVPEENKEDAFVDGMNKIYKQMMTMLEEAGVEPIEAVGKEFDPNLHNAVMQTESDEYDSGIVAQELQKGYTYRDSVVRHSMVAVVN